MNSKCYSPLWPIMTARCSGVFPKRKRKKKKLIQLHLISTTRDESLCQHNVSQTVLRMNYMFKSGGRIPEIPNDMVCICHVRPYYKPFIHTGQYYSD